MKYIRPPDFESVRELQAYYEKVEREITALLTSDPSVRTSAQLNEKMQKAFFAAVAYLSRVNRDFTRAELAAAFVEGNKSVDKPHKRSVEEARTILEKQGYKYAKNGLTKDVYIELQSATQSAGFGLKQRVNGVIERLRKEGNDSVYNVQQAILEDLKKNGLLTVEYANGAKQPLHAYAAMAARSARIESANIGAIGAALQAGTDYVKMTTMPQCCKLCGAYQGKVYCISGKDSRFPALFKTVLRNGYALPHPNCRHEFLAYFLETETSENIQKVIENSKIRYDKNGNLVDVRWQRDIKEYAAWQAGNRQLNREALEFQRMQAHYGGREDEMPYKSLGTFRRARRSDNLSPAFKAWRYRRMDEKTLNRWIQIKNFRNCPKTVDNLQEIKYNNINRWERLKRERKTITDINRKAWSDSFRERSIDSYYRFREVGIELTDHGIARFLQREIPFDTVIQIHHRQFNYSQQDGKKIKFYDELAIIYTQDEKEIVSLVQRRKAKGEWHEI